MRVLSFPPWFRLADAKVQTADMAAEWIASLVPQRRVVVQAGGCAGLWPLALAKHFGRVYTFEPAPTNFEALVANTRDVRHIYAYDYALSDRSGTSGLTRPKPGAGLWRLDGDGEVDVVTIDGFLGSDLDALDALVLDVEGSEVQALQGAEQTIAKYRPLIWLEFLTQTSVIEAWLAAHGYGPPERGIGRDVFSRPRTD